MTIYGQEYGQPIWLLKGCEKCRSLIEKVAQKIWPYPLYFGLVIGHLWPLQRRHFPEEFRADLYVFGIRRARRMGTDRVLIQNPNFYFFAPLRAAPIAISERAGVSSPLVV